MPPKPKIQGNLRNWPCRIAKQSDEIRDLRHRIPALKLCFQDDAQFVRCRPVQLVPGEQPFTFKFATIWRASPGAHRSAISWRGDTDVAMSESGIKSVRKRRIRHQIWIGIGWRWVFPDFETASLRL